MGDRISLTKGYKEILGHSRAVVDFFVEKKRVREKECCWHGEAVDVQSKFQYAKCAIL